MQNRAFGRAVARRNWRGADCVYAFNGAALEIFEEAQRRGVRCVLDQTAAPWRFNTLLLGSEREKWPGWEDSPADIDTAGEMIAREEAEWALADRIVCGSSFVVDAIRQVGGPTEKCVVVPYPIPSAEGMQGRPGRPFSGPIRVLFAGTLQLRKGIQYVWDAARRLAGRGFEFRVIGPSHLSSRAEALVKEQVDWPGRVASSDVWQHYAWADVFLLPTLSEGSANVCWEALASGIPVVATAAAGLDSHRAQAVGANTDEIVRALVKFSSAQDPGVRIPVSPRSVARYGEDLLAALS